MKYFLILITALIWLAVPFDCRASEDELVYSIINGRAVITGFRGEPEFLEIPQTIENCNVTEIKLGGILRVQFAEKDNSSADAGKDRRKQLLRLLFAGGGCHPRQRGKAGKRMFLRLYIALLSDDPPRDIGDTRVLFPCLCEAGNGEHPKQRPQDRSLCFFRLYGT